VLDLPRASYYDSLTRPLSARSRVDAALTVAVTEAHTASRGTYGAPRVHAELRLGLGTCCGRKRIARLMTAAGLVGVSHQRNDPATGRCRARTKTWPTGSSPRPENPPELPEKPGQAPTPWPRHAPQPRGSAN